MDARLRQIVSKSAGTYFIVTDNSQVANIEADSKMRLYFINSEKGAVNSLFKFAKGDKSGFTSVFGKVNRLKEKKGNFSISTCLDALDAGPIAVINLRKFDDTVDKAGIVGLSINQTESEAVTADYSKLFNTNSFWVPKGENIISNLTRENLLNIANVDTVDKSIFVTRAENITSLTAEGDKTLAGSLLEIDEFPALNFETLVADTFVDVWVFNNTFGASANTNKYYGHLFDENGNVDLSKMDELMLLEEAGYVTKFTGSLLPGLKSETDEDISIDTVINQEFMSTGIYAAINDDLLEGAYDADNYIFDIFGFDYFLTDGINKDADKPSTLLSYVIPNVLTENATVYPPMAVAENEAPAIANFTDFGIDPVDVGDNWFIGSFDQGLRLGDKIKAVNEDYVVITQIDIIGDAMIDAGPDTYQKVKYTCSGQISIKTVDNTPDPETKFVTQITPFIENAMLKPTNLVAYKPRADQFTNGSDSKQNEILDMMISPGIIKGVKSTPGIRYVVDCFKSFVVSSYKSQYGQLMVSLDEGNRFVRAILNEPFIEDMEKSTNPLFKQQPGYPVDLSYLETGGNPVYSTKLLSKFSAGEEMCFFFGPGNKVGSITRPLAGIVSNVFVQKTLAFDVAANESGYVDGIEALEYPFDDDERAFLEAFRWNPVIFWNGGNTIYGNLTGQKAKTSLQQITNSELLAHIKENLYNLSKSEAFKKGNYDDYLRTETNATNFMESLVLAGAIEPDPIVICNASNNTPEIAKQKIKLVHIEYTAINTLEKVVFDLKIN